MKHREAIENLAEQIVEVTIAQMYETINHQFDYSDLPLDDDDDYWECLEQVTELTIKNIIKILK